MSRRPLRFILAGIVLAHLPPALAAAVAPGGGNRIGFAAKQMDVTVEGEFKSFHGDIQFDPAQPEAGKASIAIDLASVATGSADADGLIRGRNFFDASHFPQATFTATSISRAAPGQFLAHGKLTMKGRSADLTLPFTLSTAPGGPWLDGGMPLSRLQFQVGQGEWADTGSLADPVQVKFHLHLPH